jgi:hypothetical protein
MIVRSNRHLEVSQLEIGTMAFATCAITIYALNWHKPKGVGVPWTLWSFAGLIPDEISKSFRKQVRNVWVLRLFTIRFESPSQIGLHTRGSSIPNHHRYEAGRNDEDSSGAEAIGLFLISVTFGAIHFAAIKSSFPNHAEKITWCVASAVCTSVAFVLWLVLSLRCCFSVPFTSSIKGTKAHRKKSMQSFWRRR